MTSTPTRLRKAVFPVAGLGTRFLPATKTIPKEMLPFGQPAEERASLLLSYQEIALSKYTDSPRGHVSENRDHREPT